MHLCPRIYIYIYLYIFVHICIYISLLAQRIAGACSVQGRWVEGFSGEWKEGRHVSCENMFSFIFFFSVFFSPFFYTQFAFAQKVQKLTHAKLGSLLVSMYVFVCVCGDAHYALYMYAYICVSICIRHYSEYHWKYGKIEHEHGSKFGPSLK